MTLIFVVKLGLRSRSTNIDMQEMYGLPLETYGMISAVFSIQNSREKVRFFDETFLLTNTSMEVVLEMPFLFFSNINIEFAELKKLIWRFHTTSEALPITSRVELIDKRESTKVALDENSETYVIHVSALNTTKGPAIHFSRAVQIAAL